MKRYCYKCGQETEHTYGIDSSGDYRETCAKCGHVNRTETEDWRTENGRRIKSRIVPEMGATLRRTA